MSDPKLKAELKLLNQDNYSLTSVRLMSFIWWPSSSRMFLMQGMPGLDWVSTQSAQVRPKAFPSHNSSSSSHNTDPPPLDLCGRSRNTSTFSPLPKCHWDLPCWFPSRDEHFEHLRSVLLAEECRSALLLSCRHPAALLAFSLFLVHDTTDSLVQQQPRPQATSRNWHLSAFPEDQGIPRGGCSRSSDAAFVTLDKARMVFEIVLTLPIELKTQFYRFIQSQSVTNMGWLDSDFLKYKYSKEVL